MGMNDTPSGERIHIGFFGKRNAGKSSLLNAVTGQELAVVSETEGTTTDPVYKAMELLPLGPVMLIDTPGFDDEGALGEQRVKKTRQVLEKTDIAVLVADAVTGMTACDNELATLFGERDIPYLIVYNKCDGRSLPERVPVDVSAGENRKDGIQNENKIASVIYVSAKTGAGIHDLKERLAAMLPEKEEKHLAADLVKPMDTVVLVVPIDSAAPKGRLILPQQQAIRDLLEAGAVTVVVRES